MTYTHLTGNERDLLAVWNGQGFSARTIAQRLSRSPATISRELGRNRSLISGQYVAISAQSRAEGRSRRSHIRHPLKSPPVYTYVLEKLRAGWSPEQISGRLEKKQDHPVIHWETIYRFIYREGNRDKYLWEYLPKHQKKRRQKTGRSVQKERIPQRVPIHARPGFVNTRLVFGHWEGDTIEGRRGEGDGIHTEVERQTRYTLACKVGRIASPETIRAQLRLFRNLPDTARQSTTLDNGREHHRHVTLRFLGMKTYFCDPYASWQRGTNENTNGLLRRYFPKGSSFLALSHEELDEIVNELNDRPRKCLGYNTPREEFEKQLKCCT